MKVISAVCPCRPSRRRASRRGVHDGPSVHGILVIHTREEGKRIGKTCLTGNAISARRRHVASVTDLEGVPRAVTFCTLRHSAALRQAPTAAADRHDVPHRTLERRRRRDALAGVARVPQPRAAGCVGGVGASPRVLLWPHAPSSASPSSTYSSTDAHCRKAAEKVAPPSASSAVRAARKRGERRARACPDDARVARAQQALAPASRTTPPVRTGLELPRQVRVSATRAPPRRPPRG